MLELELLTTDRVDIPTAVYISQPVVEPRDVVDDVTRDVTEPGDGVAAFDVAAQSIRVVVDGVTGARERFREAGVQVDLLLTTGPEV